MLPVWMVTVPERTVFWRHTLGGLGLGGRGWGGLALSPCLGVRPPEEKVVRTWQRACILLLEVWVIICVTLGTLLPSETISLLQ